MACIRVESVTIPEVHRIIPAERVQVQAAADADGVVGEPAAKFRRIPASAEIVEAGRGRVLSSLEQVPVADCRLNIAPGVVGVGVGELAGSVDEGLDTAEVVFDGVRRER